MRKHEYNYDRFKFDFLHGWWEMFFLKQNIVFFFKQVSNVLYVL